MSELRIAMVFMKKLYISITTEVYSDKVLPPTEECLAPSEERPQPLDVSHGLQVAPPVSEEGIFEDPNTARNER